ncbi:MAG TPA: hypothetical protein VMF65_20540, partial [Acidimicrobiales bacterium]|nr:hypothetical protein [Acidimicrobiales bacterium]
MPALLSATIFLGFDTPPARAREPLNITASSPILLPDPAPRRSPGPLHHHIHHHHHHHVLPGIHFVDTSSCLLLKYGNVFARGRR